MKGHLGLVELWAEGQTGKNKEKGGTRIWRSISWKSKSLRGGGVVASPFKKEIWEGFMYSACKPKEGGNRESALKTSVTVRKKMS